MEEENQSLVKGNSATPKEDKQVQQQQHHRHVSKEEKYNIVILLVLYFLQGLPIGFFSGAIPLLLVERGVSYREIGEISLCIYPFAFKFLTAPLQDTYYFKKFGQRKSYIVPLQYLFGIIIIFLSTHIEDWIEGNQIPTLTIIGFVLCFLMAQQDVAVDGWVLTMLSEDNVSIGSTCNNIGQMTGSFVSSIVFIQLNSVKFCNDYIYSSPQETALISSSGFLQFCGILCLLVTIYVHLFVKEKNSKSHDNDHTIWEVLSCLKGFVTNKKLFLFVIILCTYRMGFSPIGATFSLELIKEGYEKETLANISTLMMPLSFIVAILASRYVRKGKEMSFVHICFIARVFDCIYAYIVVKMFPFITSQALRHTLIISSSVLTTCIQNFNFVAIGSFFGRISDIDVGGSYLTVLNSLSNFGGQTSDSIALELVGTFDYNYVVIGGIVFQVIYFVVLRKKWLSLQDQPKSTWKIAIQKEKI